MTPSPDASCYAMKLLLEQRQHFFFVRVGDGAVECIHRQDNGKTCDGELYSIALADALFASLVALGRGSRVLWGDWRTAVAGSAPNHIADWDRLIQPHMRLLMNYESLLLMRRSPDLFEFYRAVAEDPRRKTYIGRDAAAAARILKCQNHIDTPMGMTLASSDFIRSEINRYQPEVVLFGAGMVGLVRVVDYWAARQTTTCIHLGSALDPLFSTKPTRSRQLSTAAARDFLKELL